MIWFKYAFSVHIWTQVIYWQLKDYRINQKMVIQTIGMQWLAAHAIAHMRPAYFASTFWWLFTSSCLESKRLQWLELKHTGDICNIFVPIKCILVDSWRIQLIRFHESCTYRLSKSWNRFTVTVYLLHDHNFNINFRWPMTTDRGH